MDPFTVMAIAGAVSAAAGVGGTMMANDAREEQANSANQWGLWMQREGQHFNATMAETTWLRNLEQWYRSVGYQQDMANTAYQRAMRDMKQAGLNPVLAYQQGGAASPAAPTASAQSASSPGFSPGVRAEVENAIAPGVNSALNAVRTVQGVQSAQEAIRQTQANTNLQQVQAGREAAATANIAQQTASEAERTGLISRQAATEAQRGALVQAQTGAAAAQAALAHDQAGNVREQTQTEIHRGHRTQAEARSAWQEAERYRNWGPRSHVTDAAASAEQISDRIHRAMRDGLGPFLRIGQ